MQLLAPCSKQNCTLLACLRQVCLLRCFKTWRRRRTAGHLQLPLHANLGTLSKATAFWELPFECFAFACVEPVLLWIAVCEAEGYAPDDGMPLGHLAGSQGQAGGDDSGQTFGDGRHSQGHRDFEVVGALGQGEADGPPGWQDRPWSPLPAQEMVIVDDPHCHTDPEDDLHSRSFTMSPDPQRVPRWQLECCELMIHRHPDLDDDIHNMQNECWYLMKYRHTYPEDDLRGMGVNMSSGS